ncbi:DUF1521 domain-containing protein [Neomegalonema sp.]|uniref:DUF1521 domain-containing protein n=1 Tax=Neomegalonema sp. TaxID=2039713 RepID=UPI0026385151|nr:DUF1521 domain-containing protein [Neomegalonema sp.]MDD2867970.1 DUF1521 domain-containing protein [Neomegalonema sp.]
MGVNALSSGFGRGFGFGGQSGASFGSFSYGYGSASKGGFGGGHGRNLGGSGAGRGYGGHGQNVSVGVNVGGGRGGYGFGGAGQNVNVGVNVGGFGGGYGSGFGGGRGYGGHGQNVNVGVNVGGYGSGYGFGGGRGGFGFGGGQGYGHGGYGGPSSHGHGGRPQASNWSVSDVKDGKGTINLGDRYSIALNEQNSVWTLTDNKYDAQTRVWGDPHVDVGNDGKTDFDFKKDSTFRLEDGTKISVGTVPFGNGDQTMSSTLAITRGRNAIAVTGLGDKYDGANNLQIQQSRTAGRWLDSVTPDGAFTAQQAGRGWTIDGKPVSQQLVNHKEGHR